MLKLRDYCMSNKVLVRNPCKEIKGNIVCGLTKYGLVVFSKCIIQLYTWVKNSKSMSYFW